MLEFLSSTGCCATYVSIQHREGPPDARTDARHRRASLTRRQTPRQPQPPFGAALRRAHPLGLSLPGAGDPRQATLPHARRPQHRSAHAGRAATPARGSAQRGRRRRQEPGNQVFPQRPRPQRSDAAGRPGMSQIPARRPRLALVLMQRPGTRHPGLPGRRPHGGRGSRDAAGPHGSPGTLACGDCRSAAGGEGGPARARRGTP